MWKLVEGLKREESLAKKKLADLEHGEGTYRKKKYKDSFKKIYTLVQKYVPGDSVHYHNSIAVCIHSF